MKSWLFAQLVMLAALGGGSAAAQSLPSNAEMANDGVFSGDSGWAGSQRYEDYAREPLWQIRANLVWLHRSKPNDAPLATDFTPGGAVLLDASEFGFDYETGPELAVLRRINDDWTVEGRFFRIDGWNASRGAVFAFGSEVQYVTPVGNSFFPATIAGSYRSELSNVEVNGRRKINDFWSLLLGFRYLGQDDDLRIEQDFGPGLALATHEIGATNGLYGFQVGADANLWSRGPLSVESLFKVGIFGNHATNRVHIDVANGPGPFDSSDSANQAAFAGELGITGVYRIGEHLSFRAGYQFLWLAGVVPASDQVAVSDPLVGTASISFTGNPSYDGAFVGMEFVR